MTRLPLERDVLSVSAPAVLVDADLLCPDVEFLFADCAERSCVVVDLGEDRWHVLSRRRFAYEMAGRLGYGRSLHAHRTIGALVRGEASPVLPAACGLEEAGRIALSRPPGRRYDDLLVRAPDGRLRTVVMVDLLRELAGLHAHRAAHDELTGLLNRAGFVAEVAAAFAGEAPVGAVLFVDLDDFKAVNDSLGHPAGDVLLQDVADRLRDAFRADDVIARLGGDEFAVLLRAATPETAQRAADRALLALAHPVVVGAETVRIAASVGIALAQDAGDADELLRNADLAMYDAKQRGKGRPAPYRPALHDRARARLELRSDLPGAIERGELRLHYQPVVDLTGGGVRGVEALVRWEHPVRGLIPPLEFLPLAEQSGAIVDLGAWVLDAACAQLARWPALDLAVNVSVVQLEEPGFARRVLDTIARHRLPAARLTLEITESAFAHETALVLATLNDLADAGITLAIDDFGTGYSSFSRLDRLPVGMLKIDRSFTVRATPTSSGVLRGLLGLAEALGLQVLVEGVETTEQAALVSALGGRLAQGYLFSKPLPPDALEELLAAEAAVAAT